MVHFWLFVDVMNLEVCHTIGKGVEVNEFFSFINSDLTVPHSVRRTKRLAILIVQRVNLPFSLDPSQKVIAPPPL